LELGVRVKGVLQWHAGWNPFPVEANAQKERSFLCVSKTYCQVRPFKKGCAWGSVACLERNRRMAEFPAFLKIGPVFRKVLGPEIYFAKEARKHALCRGKLLGCAKYLALRRGLKCGLSGDLVVCWATAHPDF